METTNLEAKYRSKIPNEYGTEEYKLFLNLIPLLGQPKKSIFAILDPEQDGDDQLFDIVLSFFHWLGIINYRGCIATHHPSDKRANFLRTLHHLSGTPEIPVAAPSRQGC